MQEMPVRMRHPAAPHDTLLSGVAMRLPDGSVVLETRKSNGHVMSVSSRQAFSPEQWARIVAGVGPDGQAVCDAATAYEQALSDRHFALAAITRDEDRARVAASMPVPTLVDPPQVAAALKAHLGE